MQCTPFFIVGDMSCCNSSFTLEGKSFEGPLNFCGLSRILLVCLNLTKASVFASSYASDPFSIMSVWWASIFFGMP